MILKICGIIVICVAAVLIARVAGSNFKIFIPIAALICIGLVITPRAAEEIGELFKKYEDHEFSEYVLILTKALGISAITTITAEICTDCGENLLSEIASFAGKAEILILCVPLISSVLEISGEIL